MRFNCAIFICVFFGKCLCIKTFMEVCLMQVSAPELKNTCRSDVTKHGTTQPLHMGHKDTEFKQATKSLKFVAEDVLAVQHPTEEFKQNSSISSISAEIQHPRLVDVTLLEAKKSVLTKTTYRDILPDPKGPANIENKKTAKKSLSFVDPTDHSREDISKKCELSSQTLPGQGEIELFQFDFFKNFLLFPATLQFHRIS